MIYNVEDIVLFNAELSMLTHIETQECISLTLSQSLILDLILQSGSDILPRDKIIDVLWAHHGINTSGHTLNQYVSLLRRLFARFEMENLIITIPRVGLRLNPEVKVTVVMENDKAEKSCEVSKISDRVPLSGHASRPDTLKKKALTCPLVCLLTIAAMVLMLFSVKTPLSDHTNPELYNYDDYTVELPKSFTSNAKTNLLNSITKKKALCEPGRALFLKFYKVTSGADYGRTMLVYCLTDTAGKIVSCDNYYHRVWWADEVI
ncbi:winged helix-turn-helix domain-containing protein [Pantoea piersonii]|uniref:winged helix-turn-helix domain-containing protein n=1 Tax=Pantoea piersonii TaxID=2364647 RepID=UPI00289BD795|nr:winged helix-turn-helix domain-containing protein [Pantoea piersonii]